MDGQPKTSFIPQKTVQVSNQVASVTNTKSKTRTIFSLISIVIFIATLVALGGVYFFKYTLQKKIEAQVSSLKQTKDEFDENFIADATRLNQRINNSSKLLENHLSPSELYSLLEQYTLQTVSFSQFSFKDTKDGNIAITGTGDAARFETIVLQSDSFGKSGYMRNVIFDNLQPNYKTGNVGFSFTATLDPGVVLYKNSLSKDNNNVEN